MRTPPRLRTRRCGSLAIVEQTGKAWTARRHVAPARARCRGAHPERVEAAAGEVETEADRLAADAREIRGARPRDARARAVVAQRSARRRRIRRNHAAFAIQDLHAQFGSG